MSISIEINKCYEGGNLRGFIFFYEIGDNVIILRREG